MCTLASILVNLTFSSTSQPFTPFIFCYPISAGSQHQLHQQLLRPSRHPHLATHSHIHSQHRLVLRRLPSRPQEDLSPLLLLRARLDRWPSTGLRLNSLALLHLAHCQGRIPAHLHGRHHPLLPLHDRLELHNQPAPPLLHVLTALRHRLLGDLRAGEPARRHLLPQH